MAGYTRQSSGLIINGATIQDSHFNNEYNQIASAFDGTTGHTHSGSAGDGPPLTATGLATNAITTVKITDKNVTYAKIQDVSATDKLLGRVSSGAGVIEEISCNALGRTIINTNAAGVRTAIGTVIGTDVQAYSAKLAAFAALTWQADYVPVFSGASTITKYLVSVYTIDLWACQDAEEYRSFIEVPYFVQDEYIAGYINYPEAKDYRIALNLPYGGVITSVTTRSEAGTATLTGKINTTALGGTANSVSTSEQTQSHASARTFAAGDDIVITLSSLSACTGISFLIKYTRTLDQ